MQEYVMECLDSRLTIRRSVFGDGYMFSFGDSRYRCLPTTREQYHVLCDEVNSNRKEYSVYPLVVIARAMNKCLHINVGFDATSILCKSCPYAFACDEACPLCATAKSTY